MFVDGIGICVKMFENSAADLELSQTHKIFKFFEEIIEGCKTLTIFAKGCTLHARRCFGYASLTIGVYPIYHLSFNLLNNFSDWDKC